ncbi:MAG: lipoate--protein ligase [Bacteroidales bacterium]
MLVIKSPSRDAYFNIAAEEYLLKNKKQDVFLLYINKPAIIVGKFQNTLAEINREYVEKNEIRVVRRLSGGGAVYHDEGNLNFSFHMPYKGEDFADFKKFTRPVVDLLNEMGVPAELKGRNDLVVDGKKFSGNAKMVYKNKLLQHGTILFDSHMRILSDALKVNPLKFKDKAVKSARARVTNLIDYLPERISMEAFEEKLVKYITGLYPVAKEYRLTKDEQQAIQDLADKKYSTWEWNYGSSPEYNFNKGIKTTAGYIEFHLDVHEGIIKKAKIFGDFFASKPINEFEHQLVGQKHQTRQLNEFLKTHAASDYFGNVSVNEILDGLMA